ncbi:YggT family protein [Massilia sp. W12]|uniref:YggT family protein n=1 Tax=Massilia sp. W12 TaxID=3126507 RepID=UPI0030D39C6A
MLLGILNIILSAVIGLLALVLLLRFWMQAVRIRPPAQLSQFTYQLSDWLVKPLRRVVPGFGGYDWASLLGAALLALATSALLSMLSGEFMPYPILVRGLLRLLNWIVYGLSGILLISVIFSWINPMAPLAPFFDALSRPMLRPIRRVLPPIANIDLSPMAALILLQIALLLLDELGQFLLRLPALL